MRSLLFACAAMTALLAFGVTSAAQPRGGTPGSRQIYVNALDRLNAPVLDLGAVDFEVTESVTRRDVTKAALVATMPMRIALLIDTSDAMSPALNHLRAGMLAFGDTIGPEHELMIVSLGRQLRVRLPPTVDRKKFRDSASGLFMDGGAVMLSDGLMEIDDRFMRKADDRWPVFVIVTSDGIEGSLGAN